MFVGDERREKVWIETARQRISGMLSVTAQSGRVSDQINERERPFVILTDVVVEPLDGSPKSEFPFMMLNRDSFVFAATAEFNDPMDAQPDAALRFTNGPRVPDPSPVPLVDLYPDTDL